VPQMGQINMRQFTARGFSASWTGVKYAKSYTVTVYADGRPIKEYSNLYSNHLNVNDLPPNKKYTIQVSVVDYNGTSRMYTRGREEYNAKGQQIFTSVDPNKENPFYVYMQNTAEATMEIINSARKMLNDGKLDRNDLKTMLPELKTTLQPTFSNSEVQDLFKYRGVVSPSVLSTLPRELIDKLPDCFSKTANTVLDNAVLDEVVKIANQIIKGNQGDGLTEEEFETIAKDMSSIASSYMQCDDSSIQQFKDVLNPFVENVALFEVPDREIAVGKQVEITPEPSIKPGWISTDSFKVFWKMIKPYYRYRVTVSEIKGAFPLPFSETVRIASSAIITNLKPKTEYEVIVQPVTMTNEVLENMEQKVVIKTLSLEEAAKLLKANVIPFDHYVVMNWKRFPTYGIRFVKFSIKPVEGFDDTETDTEAAELSEAELPPMPNYQPIQQYVRRNYQKRVTFLNLKPDTLYLIEGVTHNGIKIYSNIVRTEKPAGDKSTLRDKLPKLMPPNDLHVTAAGYNETTLAWTLVDNPDKCLTAVIRLYKPGTNIIRKKIILRRVKDREEPDTSIRITGLQLPAYDVTISTLDTKTTKESQQSYPIRIKIPINESLLGTTAEPLAEDEKSIHLTIGS